MRMYVNPLEAVREVERDLYEMGIDVHPQTMQNKDVRDNPDYATKEVRAYGFSLIDWTWDKESEARVVDYLMPASQLDAVLNYIAAEFSDRIGGVPLNPGNSWRHREMVWNEFKINGKFHYTYSERMALQVRHVLKELSINPDSRQGIITIHSNILPIQRSGECSLSQDALAMGGAGRVPCSMYYQCLIRNGKLELIYTMRSCDFLTHFPVDLMLACRLQKYMADELKIGIGQLTYFTGSLHAYAKDLKTRGIF